MSESLDIRRTKLPGPPIASDCVSAARAVVDAFRSASSDEQLAVCQKLAAVLPTLMQQRFEKPPVEAAPVAAGIDSMAVAMKLAEVVAKFAASLGAPIAAPTFVARLTALWCREWRWLRARMCKLAGIALGRGRDCASDALAPPLGIGFGLSASGGGGPPPQWFPSVASERGPPGAILTSSPRIGFLAGSFARP